MIVDWFFSILLVIAFVGCFMIGMKYQSLVDDERNERRTAIRRSIELQNKQRREQK